MQNKHFINYKVKKKEKSEKTMKWKIQILESQ